MCGVFGITGHPNAKNLLPVVMMALQHRGHDAAGVAGFVETAPNCLETLKGIGKVAQVVVPEKMEKFVGNTFICHTRYSTRNESSSTREIHPHWAQSMLGRIVIVTNGDLTNVEELKAFIASERTKIYTSNDAEMIAALINIQIRHYKKTMMEAIKHTMGQLKGGYAALVMSEEDDHIYAFRDPWGIRPMHYCLFESDGHKGVAVSSETCAFDLIERYNLSVFPESQNTFEVREVWPGSILSISKDSIVDHESFTKESTKNIGCVFESIYFSRPDSRQRGESFQVLRERMGAELFKQSPVEADLVTAVPKGGIPSAVGFAMASGLPYTVAILEEPSTGGLRSFTTNQRDRQALAQMKYNVLPDVVRGKRVVVIDDSIVRGTTSKLLVKSLFRAGATEVHFRIPCPPYSHPCHYGIETKDPSTLISHGRTEAEICQILGATSLHYLTREGLYKAIGQPSNLFCDECLSGLSPLRPL